jgi:hypothetical protein
MTLSTSQQTALEQRAVPVAYFVKLEFDSATLYLSNFNRTFTWGGQDWIGLGSLGSITEIKSADTSDPTAVTMNLNVANQSLLSIGVGPVEEYRGLPASIYMCPLSETYNLIDTPVKCWSGEMDVVAVSVDGENSSITLRCEPTAKRLRRRVALRVNNAQQQAKYPTDEGLKFQQDLINNPQIWFSREAQLAFS